MSPASSVIRKCSIFWRRRPFPIWSPGGSPISRCASGSPDAARARKPTLSPCCSMSGSPPLNRSIKLQIFASDVDPDAIASAREGLYPETIAAEVSPERLERFFSKEDHGYRVIPELRASVVFTVQDVLADPPFRNSILFHAGIFLFTSDLKRRRRLFRSSILHCMMAACFCLAIRKRSAIPTDVSR